MLILIRPFSNNKKKRTNQRFHNLLLASPSATLTDLQPPVKVHLIIFETVVIDGARVVGIGGIVSKSIDGFSVDIRE
jgi:hypothetical protein